jgi:hypothetical protein
MDGIMRGTGLSPRPAPLRSQGRARIPHHSYPLSRPSSRLCRSMSAHVFHILQLVGIGLILLVILVRR